MSSSGGYSSDQNSGSVGTPTAMNARVVIAALVILVLLIIIVASLQCYARWMWGNSSYGQWNRMRWGEARTGNIDPAALQADAGLEKRIVDALPTFVYSNEKMKAAMECSVCISEFEENETGRLLPKCNHCFHTACIDMWFRSHATCPLCRIRVGDDESIADQEKVENVRLDEEMAASPAPDQSELRINVNVTVELQSSVSNISNVSEVQSGSNSGGFEAQRHHQLDSSSDAPAKEKVHQNMQYPVNTLFYGDQTHVSYKGERFQKVEHLVIDVPSRSAAIFYPASTPITPPSTTTSSQESKTPLSHLSAIKRMLSMRERRSTSSPRSTALDHPATLTP